MSRRRSILALFSSIKSGRNATRGPVAFNYNAVFTPEESRWYRRFSIVVTGGILAPAQSELLKSNGAKLMAYRWTSAFYPDDPVSAELKWQRRVMANKAMWLLNDMPTGGASAEAGRQAFWYDFGDAGLRSARCTHLAQELKSAAYGGYFFDTLGAESIPEPLRKEFARRHPNLNYDECQGAFFKELRRALDSELIFTNQGYRRPEIYLPYANLDLSESSFTYVRDGATQFRAWRNARNPWESITTAMNSFIVPATRLFPAVSFVHLNYAMGDPEQVRRALWYGLAGARLWNQRSYLSVPGNPLLEKEEAYFEELGSPLSAAYEEEPQASVAWRRFQKGVVAINTGSREYKIASLGIRLPDPPRGYIFR